MQVQGKFGSGVIIDVGSQSDECLKNEVILGLDPELKIFQDGSCGGSGSPLQAPIMYNGSSVHSLQVGLTLWLSVWGSSSPL
jgi:hypothetical protein